MGSSSQWEYSQSTINLHTGLVLENIKSLHSFIRPPIILIAVHLKKQNKNKTKTKSKRGRKFRVNFTETKKKEENVMDDFQRGSFLGKLPYHTFLEFLIKNLSR